jgi:hypothetical protein
MKRKVGIMVGLILLAVMVLFTLNATTDRPNKNKNGFTRHFLSINATEVKRISFDVPMFNICGQKNDSIFLSGMVPGVFYTISAEFRKLDSFKLKLDAIPELKMRCQAFVEFPNVYIISGPAKQFIAGNLLTGRYESFSIPERAFYKVAMVNPETYVMQVIDSVSFNAVFKKINTQTGVITIEDHLSEKLGDAGFTNDGMLNYDRYKGLFTYVSFYHNSFMAFDTLFRLRYHSHTIDTVTATKTFVRRLSGVTQQQPPQMINTHSWIYHKHLYIKSLLKADNEDDDHFYPNMLIDRYNIFDGTYSGSFYVPQSTRDKPIEITMISDTQMIVLYNKTLVQYKISEH